MDVFYKKKKPNFWHKKKMSKSTRSKPIRCIPTVKKINGDTPHPHKAVSELIFKHFTVLYIEDFQQTVFYGVIERSFTKWHGYSGIIMDSIKLCTKQP